MIDRNHDLSITRQVEVLGMNWGAVYYLPRPTSAKDLSRTPSETAKSA